MQNGCTDGRARSCRASRGPISVVSVHLAGSPEERGAQADAVTAIFEGRGHPVILAGDFNVPARLYSR